MNANTINANSMKTILEQTINNGTKLASPTQNTQLLSYTILIFIFIILLILVIILYFKNNNGFTNVLGYEIFITIPIVIFVTFMFYQIILLQTKPTNSILSVIPFSDKPFFPILSIVIIIIAAIFSILGIGGVFSVRPPENNIAVFINLIVIILFVIISGGIYYYGQQKDKPILEKMSPLFNDIYALRTKYTIMCFAVIICITLLYFLNPLGIMTTYGGMSVFFSLFTGLILISMTLVYHYFISNPSNLHLFQNAPNFLLLIKGLYIIIALALSGLLIYGALNVIGVFNQDATKPETYGHTLFNLLLLCGMLGMVYKLANVGGYLDKNPLYRLILNTILYIPCLLVIILHKIAVMLGLSKTPGTASGFSQPAKFEIIMLVICISIILCYFLTTSYVAPYLKSKYYKQGGTQIINQPIRTDILTNIASYSTLNKADTINYHYAMSFWLYIDAFPPSTNTSYNKIVSVLSYGDNPCIKYNSIDNTLLITVKQKLEEHNTVDYIMQQEKTMTQDNINLWTQTQNNIRDAIATVKSMPILHEIDADGNRIIYTHPEVKLQKWNNIVINYNGGTLDIFYNGKLMKSSIDVVPYIKLDMLTVGSPNGISGNIANLIYFNSPLDIETINTLYNSLKHKNPPCIIDDNTQIVPIIT